MKKMALLLTVAMAFAVCSFGQKREHPPGQPDKYPTAANAITLKKFVPILHHYIEKTTKDNGGYFPVHDSVQNKDLKLTLDSVMTDHLAAIGNNTYFVCSDFQGQDGNTYDVDIYMKGKGPKQLKATQMWVHKVNSVPRYTWYQYMKGKADYWGRKAVPKSVQKQLRKDKKKVSKINDKIAGLQKKQKLKNSKRKAEKINDKIAKLQKKKKAYEDDQRQLMDKR